LAIGSYASGLCWDEFDYVINCAEAEYEQNKEQKNYLHLAIPEGKKGQITFGTSIKKAIEFVRDPLLQNRRILVHCATGNSNKISFQFLLTLFPFIW
jgi:tRNA A64-2'-O-ribosylphosphate transferase